MYCMHRVSIGHGLCGCVCWGTALLVALWGLPGPDAPADSDFVYSSVVKSLVNHGQVSPGSSTTISNMCQHTTAAGMVHARIPSLTKHTVHSLYPLMLMRPKLSAGRHIYVLPGVMFVPMCWCIISTFTRCSEPLLLLLPELYSPRARKSGVHSWMPPAPCCWP